MGRDDMLDPRIECDELNSIATRLAQARPVPSTTFRGDLRRWYSLENAKTENLPLLRRLAVACGTSGTALLTVVLLGAAGAGPLAS